MPQTMLQAFDICKNCDRRLKIGEDICKVFHLVNYGSFSAVWWHVIPTIPVAQQWCKKYGLNFDINRILIFIMYSIGKRYFEAKKKFNELTALYTRYLLEKTYKCFDWFHRRTPWTQHEIGSFECKVISTNFGSNWLKYWQTNTTKSCY